MDIARLRSDLKRHEGVRLKPYRDTVGKLTVGYGRNIEDEGVSVEEAEVLLENDIRRAHREVMVVMPSFAALNDVRQEVLVNMMFNMGRKRFLGFEKMRQAILRRDFGQAADEMLNSQWYKQVGYRAKELAERMRTGKIEGGSNEKGK